MCALAYLKETKALQLCQVCQHEFLDVFLHLVASSMFVFGGMDSPKKVRY